MSKPVLLKDLEWEHLSSVDAHFQSNARVNEHYRIYRVVRQDGKITYSLLTPYVNPHKRGLKDHYNVDALTAQCLLNHYLGDHHHAPADMG